MAARPSWIGPGLIMAVSGIGASDIISATGWSHYFDARLAEQFDVMIHLDETTALVPLEKSGSSASGGELPRYFPSSL